MRVKSKKSSYSEENEKRVSLLVDKSLDRNFPKV